MLYQTLNKLCLGASEPNSFPNLNVQKLNGGEFQKFQLSINGCKTESIDRPTLPLVKGKLIV